MNATKRRDQWWYVLIAPCALALSFLVLARLPTDGPVVSALVMGLVVFTTLGITSLVLRAARTRR